MYIFPVILRFLSRACAEIALILVQVQNLPSPSCAATEISYKGKNFGDMVSG